jgi:hypothetical protein
MEKKKEKKLLRISEQATAKESSSTAATAATAAAAATTTAASSSAATGSNHDTREHVELLSVSFAAALDALLRSAVGSGATVVLASHERDRALGLATRTVTIDGGGAA